MDQSPFSPAPGVFPISLLKTIRLITTLLYLQLLYAVSYLALPLRNSRREFPPFNGVIVRIETKITTAILGTAPLSAYNSATATERQWQLTSGNGLLNQESNIQAVPQSPNQPAISAWPQEAQRYSSSSDEHGPSKSIIQEPIAKTGPAHQESSSVYDTIYRLRSSTRGSISTIASSARAIFRQPLSMVSRNLDGSPSEQRHDVRHEPELVVRAPVCTPDPGFVENVPFPVPKIAPVRAGDHFSDPGPESAIKVQQAVAFGASIDAAVDEQTVQMNRSRKYHSVESFPGKFPVSDGLNYSSLATAYAVRGRGTTSVRPFSDY